MTTASPLTLHPAPAASFDEPFEMLLACHDRVRRMLSLLQRLQMHLAGHGADDQAAAAARDLMRYFDSAGPAHHEDEERHILPELVLQGHAALAGRLHAEHQRMAADWAVVRAALQQVAAGQAVTADATAPWQAFAALYGIHIDLEEGIAYPAVLASADPATQQAMGHEMAARRGLL